MDGPLLFNHYPLWAVTNLAVGSRFPLLPGIFELAILDEASQCDIPSAIPIIFRAKRVAVVGDYNAPQNLDHRISEAGEGRQAELCRTTPRRQPSGAFKARWLWRRSVATRRGRNWRQPLGCTRSSWRLSGRNWRSPHGPSCAPADVARCRQRAEALKAVWYQPSGQLPVERDGLKKHVGLARGGDGCALSPRLPSCVSGGRARCWGWPGWACPINRWASGRRSCR